jgi:hypothetical protein
LHINILYYNDLVAKHDHIYIYIYIMIEIEMRREEMEVGRDENGYGFFRNFGNRFQFFRLDSSVMIILRNEIGYQNFVLEPVLGAFGFRRSSKT